MNVKINSPRLGVCFGNPVIREGGGEPYTGDYEVTPSTETQTLPTTNKKLSQDVTVNPIPSGWYNTLKEGVMRPDAELIQTFSYDKFIVEDEGVTIPSYSTAAVLLKETETLSPEIPTEWSSYRYYVIERFLTIPIYNTTAKLKGRCEYCATDQFYELFYIPPNTISALADLTDKIASVGISQQSGGGSSRQPYYSADNVLNVYTSSTYGAVQAAQSPSVNGFRIQVRSPKFNIRGTAAQLPENVWNTITDIRYQYFIEVWRAPLNSMGVDGWGTLQDMLKIIECAQSATHKLT